LSVERSHRKERFARLAVVAFWFAVFRLKVVVEPAEYQVLVDVEVCRDRGNVDLNERAAGAWAFAGFEVVEVGLIDASEHIEVSRGSHNVSFPRRDGPHSLGRRRMAPPTRPAETGPGGRRFRGLASPARPGT
jgi:hypothetical protein